MDMASSEVEMASSQTFNWLLRDRSRHEKCIRDNNKSSNNNNVRTVHTVIKKICVRDHLNDNSSISREDYNGKRREIMECPLKSPVCDRKQTRESPVGPQISSNSHLSLPSSPFLSGPGQPENLSTKEILGASSLVQIWEARMQIPNSGQSQALSNGRTTSGLSQTENSNSCSESINNDMVKELEVIQPEMEDVDRSSQSDRIRVLDFGEKEKEREGVRVLDIIRKLSNDPETINDININGINDSAIASNKEVLVMEHRSFPQVACIPRIRGRQAYEALLTKIMQDRTKELAWLFERHVVSKFTYRGRLQSILKIRCLERCKAIQDSHRSKSTVSDVTRTPRGSILMNLRDKFKTDSENSRVANMVEARSSSGFVSSRVNEGDHHHQASRLKVWLAEDVMPHKDLQETVEKNVLQEKSEKNTNFGLEVNVKAERTGVANVDNTVEPARVYSGLASLRVNENNYRLDALRVKACLAEDAMLNKPAEESCFSLHETKEKNVLQDTTEKSNSRVRQDANWAVEYDKKAVFSGSAENKTPLMKHAKTTEEKADKTISNESAEEKTSMRTMEKVNMWSSKEKKVPKNPEGKDESKGKVVPHKIEKKVMLQEAERRIVNVEAAERSISSRETVENITLREMTDMGCGSEVKLCYSVEVERSKKEIGNMKNPVEVVDMTCLYKRDMREEEETTKHVSEQATIEKYCLLDDKEVSVSSNSDAYKEEIHESSTMTCLPLGSMEIESNRDECVTVQDEDDDDEQYMDYDPYNEESTYDWINDISRPRSYWEDLRKQWYLEVLSTDSPKEDIRSLIERRTVSDFLSSDLREKIDKLMISRTQQGLGSERSQDHKEEELQDRWTIQGSESDKDNREEKEEEEEDKGIQEERETNNQWHEVASDGFSQSSAQSTMMSWSFRDQDVGDDQYPVTSLSLPAPSPSDRSSFPTIQDTSPEMQMICDLKSQIDQLQFEMLELRNSIKSCIDVQHLFQNRDSCSGADQQGDTRNPLKRKCCVCYEMPVDSLLYRCGHICTCLKCAHELQWKSGKCPICMAPIVDVVRAFLDS